MANKKKIYISCLMINQFFICVVLTHERLGFTNIQNETTHLVSKETYSSYVFLERLVRIYAVLHYFTILVNPKLTISCHSVFNFFSGNDLGTSLDIHLLSINWTRMKIAHCFTLTGSDLSISRAKPFILEMI